MISYQGLVRTFPNEIQSAVNARFGHLQCFPENISHVKFEMETGRGLVEPDEMEKISHVKFWRETASKVIRLHQVGYPKPGLLFDGFLPACVVCSSTI
ncbi:hypothetical protein [Aeromonas salmonicida]|nr:hypothetical protein [Aeromonas salmonicida]